MGDMKAFCKTVSKPMMDIFGKRRINILNHLFASVANNGDLPEAGKQVMAESTGLSPRSIVGFFDKYRKDHRFVHAAGVMANLEV